MKFLAYEDKRELYPCQYLIIQNVRTFNNNLIAIKNIRKEFQIHNICVHPCGTCYSVRIHSLIRLKATVLFTLSCFSYYRFIQGIQSGRITSMCYPL